MLKGNCTIYIESTAITCNSFFPLQVTKWLPDRWYGITERAIWNRYVKAAYQITPQKQ